MELFQENDNCQGTSGFVFPCRQFLYTPHFLFAIESGYEIWPRGYKTFFVLNSVEHEILNAHKYKNIKKFGFFKAQLSLESYFSRSYMLKCQQLLAF